MQTTLPNNLNYNDVKPIGFPSNVRQEKFTPIAFNTSTQGVSSSDVVRFNISSNGFWDPYSAYIKLEIDVTTSDGAISSTLGSSYGSQQIDNSASSFINQLIISKGGTEIERIEEYDVIASILNDVNSSYDNRQTRQYEGMTANQSCNWQYTNVIMAEPGAGNQYGYSNFPNYTVGALDTETTLLNQFVGNTTSGCSRYEYFKLQRDQTHTVTKLLNNTNATFAYSNSIYNQQLSSGYTIPFNISLSAGGNELLITKNFLTTTTYRGQLNQHIIGDRITFCIPLISGLLGVLMPQDSYKYIPMKALQDLILEFRLNPYAMFTSGWKDPNSSTNMTSSTQNPSQVGQLNRLWRITKFELNVEMQYFEPSVENIILSQLNTEKGIIIHSQSWQLGPRYQFSANTSPNGTYQVNLGYESLKNVIWCFMPDDYLTYSFCRKQYRLSANITSMYLKIGTEYYPPLPITGHAGTPYVYSSSDNQTDANNSEFVIQLYKTFNKFHNIRNNCMINNVNFAVNERPYNPADNNTFNTGSLWNNWHAAASSPLFHENRCVGRAIYAMNLETLNQDYSVISGMNTINNRPFEINLKSDQTNSFARPYTMYVFCNYDMLIQLKSTSVNVLGKG